MIKLPVLPRRTVHVLALLVIVGIWCGVMMPFGDDHAGSSTLADAAGVVCRTPER